MENFGDLVERIARKNKTIQQRNIGTISTKTAP